MRPKKETIAWTPFTEIEKSWTFRLVPDVSNACSRGKVLSAAKSVGTVPYWDVQICSGTLQVRRVWMPHLKYESDSDPILFEKSPVTCLLSYVSCIACCVSFYIHKSSWIGGAVGRVAWSDAEVMVFKNQNCPQLTPERVLKYQNSPQLTPEGVPKYQTVRN